MKIIKIKANAINELEKVLSHSMKSIQCCFSVVVKDEVVRILIESFGDVKREDNNVESYSLVNDVVKSMETQDICCGWIDATLICVVENRYWSDKESVWVFDMSNEWNLICRNKLFELIRKWIWFVDRFDYSANCFHAYPIVDENQLNKELSIELISNGVYMYTLFP